MLLMRQLGLRIFNITPVASEKAYYHSLIDLEELKAIISSPIIL